MLGGKRTVKWLDAEFSRVLFETIRIHQRNRSESPDVGVVQSSAVVEVEPQRRIVELGPRESAVVDQERAREARLYDDSVAGVEIDHHELGPAPAAEDRGVVQPLRDRARTHFAQHIGFANGNLFYLPPADRAVEIPRDRLGLR